MRELSLFTGIGGGVLGTKLLGLRHVGYVENDPYCQAVLEARIRGGVLDPAPIFGDIRAFHRLGHVYRYRGVAEVVSAGFPCQPHSIAGKRLGAADERDLWPDTAEVVRAVRPAVVFLENSPGLVTSGYIGRVLGSLASMGFDAQWGVFSALEAGAPHLRKRWFLLAIRRDLSYAECYGVRNVWERSREQYRLPWAPEFEVDGNEGPLADGNGGRCEEQRLAEYAGEQCAPGDLADGCSAAGRRDGQGWWDVDPADGEPGSESFVGRVAHGDADLVDRPDRLRGIGNAQVPRVVVEAWRDLMSRFQLEERV